MLSIPEYFSKYIDKSVDLDKTPKICCPFHDEDTPSFSYSSDRGVWRCFGSCHTGGDVYDLHRKHMHFKTKEEAVIDLNKREGGGDTDISFSTASTFKMTDMDAKISMIALKLQFAFTKGDIPEILKQLQEATLYKL